MKSWYAVCENGGEVGEYIWPTQYVTKREAWEQIETLYDWEQEALEDGWWPDDAEFNKYDVVRVFEDGTVTTEC